MNYPFENDTSAVIKKLARKSVRFDKKKNLFCLSAIIVAVAMIMMSLLTVQNIIYQNQKEIEGLHQGIFFDITQDSKEKLLANEEVKSVGLSCNIKTVKENSKELSLIYYDDDMLSLIPAFDGKYPEKASEIAVTDAFFASENKSPEINAIVQLNLDGTLKNYTIVGIYHDKTSTAYPVFVSLEKCRELRGNNLLNGYVWLENADTLTKDEATEILSQISEETGLNNWTVSSYYDYVNTTLSFSNYAVYGVVAAILFLAAALVIYSIFYISVGQKVADLCGACLFGILLVYISVRKPAKIAANTSPISALKNPVGIVNYRTHKRHRITPVYLAKISFSRNRKKSLLTILSLGLCGVIFFLAASYQSSFNAESMARYWDMKYGDFKISIDLENESENLDALLQKEYFSDYVKRVGDIEGVSNIFTYATVPVDFSTDNDISDSTLMLGYNEKDLASLNAAVLSGNITDDTELVVSDPERIYDVYHWKPQIGDTVTFNFKNHSGKTITKAFKIGAITSSNDGMGGYIFRMPENMLKELAGYDCTYAIEIQAEAEYQEIIEQELKLLVSDNRDVRLQTLQDFIVEHQSDNRAGFTLAYAIAAILWIFAVINQINLTVTNLLSQKQEMGTLKSIGMTNKQLKQAFMMEGLFTTLIALLITAVVGIPGGYAIGIFLKNAGMSTGFVFPVVAFTLFAVAMFMLESLMTILLIHSWKKQSVIAIMRN